ASVEHPEIGRSLQYAVRKWSSTEPDWCVGRRAPLVGEDSDVVWKEVEGFEVRRLPAVARREATAMSPHGKPVGRRAPLVGEDSDVVWKEVEGFEVRRLPAVARREATAMSPHGKP